MHSAIYTNIIVIPLRTVLVIRKLFKIKKCLKDIKACAEQ